MISICFVSFIKQILFLLSQYAQPLAGMARFELFPVQGVASTKMEVVPSPLEIKISSGGLARRVVAKDETIFLYAEDNSVDPDDPGKVGWFPKYVVNIYVSPADCG